LLHIAQKKELSFGEKSLLQQTEMLLAQEISIVKKAQEETTIEQLRILIQQANQSGTTII
jgi:RNA polymerase-interacting CarD/CdnL/TRCF family regulator